jgi:hypothetical protein
MIEWLEQRAAPQVMRDRGSVRVERRRADDGTLFYRKRFFEDLHEEGWLGRENRVLLWFAIRDPYPRHLVRLKRVNFLAGGRLDVLDTYDAGPSLKEWGEVGMPATTDSARRIRPFNLCNNWWHLADAALGALDELHALGLVHADVKEDNLCIPFDTESAAQGWLKLRFRELRLIDVTYSILPDVPLTRPLPLDPLPDSYQAKLMQAAIEADERLGRPDHANRLDWRVDLFSLGSMLERLLDPQPAYGWNNILHGKARDLIDRLKAHDSPDSALDFRRERRPHTEYRRETQGVVRSLPEPTPWPIGGIPRLQPAKDDHVPVPGEGGKRGDVRPGSTIVALRRRITRKWSAKKFAMAFVVGASVALLLFLFYRTLAI